MAIIASHSNLKTTSVTLTGTSDGGQYRLWEYKIGSGVWKAISASASYTASISVTGLSENTTYSYQIRAINTSTNILEYSTSKSFTTLKNTNPPVITASVTAIGADRFTINGSTTYTCKTWQYQLNGGTWTSLSTSSSATNASKVITGLSENTTYTVGVRATRTYNNVTGTSGTVSATTTKSQTPPTVTASISAIGTKGFTIKGTANYTCKTWQYRIGSGAWTSLSTSSSATSVSKAITGLTPATKYSVTVRATRTYNNVVGTSSAVSATTIGASTMNSANTVTADAGTVSVTFNWTVPSGTGFTHTLRIKDGGTTVVTVTGLTGSSGSKTISLNSTQRTALLNRMPNKKSFTGTFELETLDGATRVGSLSSKTATVTTTEANSKPTFTGFTHSEKNTKVSNVQTSYYVQNLSVIEVICTAATAKNGSTISKYVATYGGATGSSNHPTTTINLGTPTACGANLTITVYAEDSRGYRTTLTDTKTNGCYSAPNVLEWQYRRKDSIGEETAFYVKGQTQRSASALLLEAQYRTKLTTAPSYGAWAELTPMTEAGESGGKRFYEYSEPDWETFDSDKSYHVQIRFQDSYEEYSTSITFTVARGIPLMSFRDGKVGINQYDPQGALDVVGDTYFDGKVFADTIGVGKIPVAGRALDIAGRAYIDGFPIHKKITDRIHFPASSSWYRVLEVRYRSFYLELILYRQYNSPAPEIHRLGIGATHTGGGITKIDSHGTKIFTNARLLYDANADRCYVDLKYDRTSHGNSVRLFYDYYSFSEDVSTSLLTLPGAANAVAESTTGYTVFSQVTL